MKPISPLARMPLALYTIRIESVVDFRDICSLWSMLINTAFGVAAVRREWINVARTRSRHAGAPLLRRPAGGRPPSSPACASRSALRGW
jgi:ABC-type nitrate/sulfonate/bicarbonate transport system permease component